MTPRPRHHRGWATARAPRAEEGFVGGLEALAFGALVFVIGTLILVNGWAVIDAKFATNAAAREAVRAVVETGDGASADELRARALAAAQQAGAAHGFADAGTVSIEPLAALTQVRCATVTIRADIVVRGAILPGVSTPLTRTVSSVHQEVIDPFRTGLEPSAGPGLDSTVDNPCGF